MKKTNFLCSMVILFSLLTLSCFEKFYPNESQETVPQIPQQIIFKGPNSSKAPKELQNSLDEFNKRVSTGLTYLSIATIKKPKVEGNQSTWQVSAGGFSSLIVAEKKSDESVNWKITINGSDHSATYTNWIALVGTANPDGTSGFWHVFKENSTIELGVYTWNVKDNNQKEGSFSINNSTIIYNVKNLPDQSGSYNKKENEKKVYEAVWDRSGSGTWHKWDEIGNVAGSGGWS